MYYAPVIIPTLCRFEHFKECMESLARNTEAKNTEIFIGLDYPAKEAHREGYEKICKYLNETQFPFAKVNVLKREVNYGVSKNVEDLRDTVRQKYDRFIFTEDDNVFSDKFLEYINTMLEKIKDKDDVFGVCGYSYPIDFSDQSDNDSEADGKSFFVKTAFPAWGYGTFFDKRDKLLNEYTKELLITGIKSGKNSNLTKKLGDLFNSWYVNRSRDKNITYNDIDIQLYEILTDKVSVMPCKSLVRNMGWDGSGINCQTGAYDFSSQEIYDGEISDNILPQEDEREIKIWKFISSLNTLEPATALKTRIKFILIKAGLLK